jgi:hypothetical protein
MAVASLHVTDEPCLALFALPWRRTQTGAENKSKLLQAQAR